MTKQRVMRSTIGVSPLPWWKIFLAIIPGLCTLWIERPALKVDYGDRGFVVAVLVSVILMGIALSQEHRLAPWSWPVFGMLLWSGWRFLHWVLNDRVMLFLVNYLTSPVQRMLGADATELITYVAITIVIIGGAWGTYWIYKHFDGRWIRWGVLYLVFLLVIIVATAFYTSSEETQTNCFGVTLISSGLHCLLRADLGLMGTIWITLVLLLLPVTFALQQAKTYGPLVSLFVIVFEPAWIEMLFNPVQVLGVPYFRLLRTPLRDTSLYPSLDFAINIVNALPIVSFLLIIPAGLLIFRSDKLRLWWVVSLSAITFAAIFLVLIQTLALVRPAFEYSLLDYFMFGLFIVQLWMPVLIVAVVSHKLRIAEQIKQRGDQP